MAQSFSFHHSQIELRIDEFSDHREIPVVDHHTIPSSSFQLSLITHTRREKKPELSEERGTHTHFTLQVSVSEQTSVRGVEWYHSQSVSQLVSRSVSQVFIIQSVEFVFTSYQLLSG